MPKPALSTPPGAQSVSRKERSHDRIVDAAARAIRRRGYDGVGVAEVMKEAGLTHGGFYAHFPSRDALLVAAIERAGRRSGEVIARRLATRTALQPGVTPFRALVESYLADGLLRDRDGGCPVAALCSEMPRQTPDVRRASSARVRALVRYVASALPSGIDPDQAGPIAATLVGSLQLARAMATIAEGKALLASARTNLLTHYDRP